VNRWAKQWRRGLFGLAIASLWACDSPSSEGRLDTEVRVHVIEPSTPTAEGLAYVARIAEVHRRAQSMPPGRRPELYREALRIEAPDGVGEAEILRLGLTIAAAETLMVMPERRAEAYRLLSEELRPERSLPLDESSARALVTLGDVAEKLGHKDAAVSSYARAVRLMGMLREEIEP
jgi:hypothetical protein